MIRIMIVDDHQIVREGLKKILELEDDFTVVGIAASGLESLELASQLNPDIVFMDIKMPGIKGTEATRLLCEKHPGIKIIMLTVYDDTSYIAQAIEAGASAYVLKDADRTELVEVVRRVKNGENILAPELTAKMFDRLRSEASNSKQSARPVLTKRELEVLKGLVAGWNDKQVGLNLHISTHTARTHVKNVYNKLGVSSRSQAVALALKSGLIEEN